MFLLTVTSKASFERAEANALRQHLAEPRRLIQFVGGPHQAGKTTLVQQVVAIEVKSGAARGSLSGLAAFSDEYQPTRTLLVGGDGIPLEEFLAAPAGHWLQS